MKHIGFSLFLSLTLFSCKEKVMVLDYEMPEGGAAQNISITLDKESKGILYSDLYAKVDYVQLEMTEQSLVGDVSKLEIADNGDIILLDNTRGSVIRFNASGKYVCHIGSRGNGHGEYITASDIAYDRYNNYVIVLDKSSCKLVTYDLDGRLVYSTQLGYMPSCITVLDEEHLCLYMNHYEDLSKRLVGNNFKIINRKGNLISEFMEFDATMTAFHPACDNVFFYMDSRNCFKQPFSSLIYSMDNVKDGMPNITPELYIDFDDKKIPQEWYRGAFREMLDKLQEGGIMYLSSIYKVKDRLILNIARNRAICMYILNIQDRSLDKFGFYAHNDMFGFVSSISLSTIKDKKCYFIINPSEFDFYKENIDKEGSEFYTVDKNFKPIVYVPSKSERNLLNSIHDGDNPIIQICTLKD